MLRFILLRLKPNNVIAIFKAVYQCGSLNRWNLCRPKTMQCYFNFDASEIVSTKQKWLKNIQEVEHLQFLIRKIPSRNKSGSSFTRINYFHVNIENKSKKSFLHFIVLKIVCGVGRSFEFSSKTGWRMDWGPQGFTFSTFYCCPNLT